MKGIYLSYDVRDRLVGWTGPAGQQHSYGYDGGNNMVDADGQAATFDEQNRILSRGGSTFEWFETHSRAL